jgi:DNA transposition AAA+ family ATPase
MSSTVEDALEDGPQELDETAVRAAFDAATKQDGRPLARLAPEVGIAYGTLSAWRGGTYLGDNRRVTIAAQAWLLQRVARARQKTLLPAEPGFIMTKTAGQIWELLEFAQSVPTLGLVVGGAGVGKTTAFKGYRAQLPNTVWIATMQPCHRTIAASLHEIQATLGMSRDFGQAAISRSIAKRIRGTKGLLIVDEAQHLSPQALDQIRSLADATEIGFVLGGSQTLLTNMGADNRQAQLAQVFSRVGMRLKRDRPLKADIEALLDAWRIEAAETRQELLGIALKPGGGRVMTMILRIAFGLAGADSAPLPSVEHVRMAWQQIGATTGAV